MIDRVENKSKKIRAYIISALVFAALLLADLLTKQWAVDTKPNAYLFNGCGFTLTYNSGMAFGIASDNKSAMIAVIVVTVFIMLAIAVAYFKVKKGGAFIKILFAVIEAGAIGNLVDRIMWLSGKTDGVRDFIDISFIHFGICNLADFCVTLGGLTLLVYILFFCDDPLIPVFKKNARAQSDSSESEKNDGEE